MNFVEGFKSFLSKSLMTYLLAALILVGMADYKKAVVERLNQLVESGSYPGLLEYGNVNFDERSLRIAIRYYKLVTQLYPLNDGPYAMVGYCYAKLGENTRGIHYYEQALKVAPNHVWYDYNLAILYLRGHDNSRAIEFFHKVTGQDIHSSIEASILAPLTKIPPQERQILLAQAIQFSLKIREDAFKQIIKLELENKQYDKAIAELKGAIKDPSVQDKEKFLKDTQVSTIQEGSVVLHPWASYIQPGKEVYLE